MEDYDYVMMVDENGSPYLAHVDWGKARQSIRNAASSAAGAVKSAGKKSYKYYQKLKEGSKTLYFYSPEELKAHYDNLRRQASGAVDKAKKTAVNVRDNAQVAITSTRRKADDLRGKAAQTAAKARQTADNMRSEFARRADQASSSVKDWAGVDERERRDAADKAHDDALKTMNEAQARYESAQEKLDEAHDLRADAKRNGGAGLSRAEELVREAAREREAARKAYNKAQQDYNTAYENRDKAQEDYDKTLLGAADYAKDRVSTAVGANEKRIRDEAKRNYDNGHGDADSYNRAQELYDKTLLGRIDKAKEAVGNAASNARETAGRAIDSAQEGARKAVDASKSKFDRMKDDFAKKAGQAKEAVGNVADDARETVSNAANSARETAGRAIASAKDKAGVDERERRDAAKKAADEAQTRYDSAQDRLDEAHELRADAKRNGGAGLSRAEELVREAAREREAARKDNEAKQKAYRDAQSEYDSTFLGKGDKAKEVAGRAAGEAVSGIREVWNKLSSGKTLTKKDLEILKEYNRQNR